MTKRRCSRLLFAVSMGIILGSAVSGFAESKGPKYQLPEGVYINLTEDFYRALREAGDSGTTTYRSEQSGEYLRQIAVSTRFMVETNLQILKQQEHIIRLLETIHSKDK